MYILLAILSAFFAGVTAIAGKIALQKVSPLWVASIKTFLMTLFLLIISFIYAGDDISILKQLDRKTLFVLLFTAITGALSWIFSFYALKLGDVHKVNAIDKMSLVFVLFFAIILLHEKVTWLNILGISFIVLGSIMVIK